MAQRNSKKTLGHLNIQEQSKIYYRPDRDPMWHLVYEDKDVATKIQDQLIHARKNQATM